MSLNEEILVRAILAGRQEYMANAAGIAAANEEIAASTDMIGAASERTTRRGFFMNQMMFTARRLLYGTSLAFIGAGIAAVKWGFDFNSAMQTARIALEPVFGSTAALNKELDYLFNFTKYTPFQFKDVTTSFRVMFGAFHQLGISADTTNKTIKSIVDSLAFAGKTSPGQLNRVATALQHMAFMGHITGQIVNQLARDGLPVMPVLSKEFGLTGDQIHRIGTLGIPTLEFLKRFNHFVATTPGYANAAYRQATMSLHGLFTTFKDNLSQLMGHIEKNFFSHIQNRLVDMNHWFDRIQAAGKNGNIEDIIKAIGGPGALLIWHQVIDNLREFWHLFSTIVGTLAHSKIFWATVYLALLSIHGVLALINPLLQGFGGTLLYFLIPALVTWWMVTKVAAFWQAALTLEEVLATKATKDLTFFQFLAAIATGRYAIAARVGAFASGLYALALNSVWIAGLRVSAVVFLLGLRMKAAALLTRGLAAAQALLTIALGEEATAAIIAWAATLGPIALVLGALAAVAAAIYLIIRYWGDVKKAFNTSNDAPLGGLFGLNSRTGGHGRYAGGGVLGNWLSSKGVPTWLTGAHKIPGMATGGTVVAPGLSWVGESGPELLSLPVGASVIPSFDSAFSRRESWMGGGGAKTVIAKVYLDKRQIAEAVADIEDEQGARS